jgi:hypothetical protein
MSTINTIHFSSISDLFQDKFQQDMIYFLEEWSVMDVRIEDGIFYNNLIEHKNDHLGDNLNISDRCFVITYGDYKV